MPETTPNELPPPPGLSLTDRRAPIYRLIDAANNLVEKVKDELRPVKSARTKLCIRLSVYVADLGELISLRSTERNYREADQLKKLKEWLQDLFVDCGYHQLNCIRLNLIRSVDNTLVELDTEERNAALRGEFLTPIIGSAALKDIWDQLKTLKDELDGYSSSFPPLSLHSSGNVRPDIRFLWVGDMQGTSAMGLARAAEDLSILRNVHKQLQPRVQSSLGYSAPLLKAAGYSAFELRVAKYSASDLKAAGYTLSELKTTGYTPSDLKSAGYTPSELKTAGYTVSELRVARYSASDLKAAGYTLSELKTTGYTPSDLKSAGYTPSVLQRAGYTLSDLKAAGYSASDMKTAGCSASDLRIAGYSLSELKAAEYGASKVIDAGYPLPELKRAGYTVLEVKRDYDSYHDYDYYAYDDYEDYDYSTLCYSRTHGMSNEDRINRERNTLAKLKMLDIVPLS